MPLLYEGAYEPRRTFTVRREQQELPPSVWDEFQRMGDVNRDGVIDDKDLTLIRDRLGAKVGEPDYDPTCDLNQDGIINTLDILIVASNYGKTIWEYWVEKQKEIAIKTPLIIGGLLGLGLLIGGLVYLAIRK